jgi:hypothetical protein
MAYSNRFMIGEILYCSGRPLTVRQIIGAVRSVFAVTLSNRVVRRTCYETPEFKRGGSSEYLLDEALRTERLVRELMAA